MKHVIFTADDFGLAPEVNAAVEEAHRHGVLTAASLMVAAPAATDAIARARQLPKLGVGLHVVVADGHPMLPAAQIPALVNERGLLPSNLIGASLAWAISSAARAQLGREIEAQFAAFRATGLALDHVNVHNHMHLHPVVLHLVIATARRYGARHLRLPSEPPRTARDYVARLGLAPWIALIGRRARAAGLATNDWLLGLGATGHMTEDRVLAGLENLAEGVTEFYFHPATRSTAALDAAAPGYDRIGELAALTSLKVRARVQDQGLKPCNFRELP